MCGVRLPLSGMVLISLLSKIVSPYSVKCLPKVQGNLLGKHRKLKEMAPVGMADAIPTGAFIQTSILGAGNIHTGPSVGIDLIVGPIEGAMNFLHCAAAICICQKEKYGGNQ